MVFKSIKIALAGLEHLNSFLFRSVAGTWTRVSRVRAEYPNQLDYNGDDTFK